MYIPRTNSHPNREHKGRFLIELVQWFLVLFLPGSVYAHPLLLFVLFLIFIAIFHSVLAYFVIENPSTLKHLLITKSWTQSLAIGIIGPNPMVAMDEILDGFQMWFTLASRRKFFYLSRHQVYCHHFKILHQLFFSQNKKLDLPKTTHEGNWVLLVRASSIIGNWNLKGTF